MVGDTFYGAGTGDYTPKGTFAEQVKNCLTKIGGPLKKAGLDYKNVVSAQVWLQHYDKFAEFNKVYSEFFKEEPPVRTTIGIRAQPGNSTMEITVTAYKDMSKRKRVGDLPAGLPFSPAVWAGDTLYIAGKGDQLPDGKHPGTFEEQVRQCMRNVESGLKAGGLTFGHVVFCNVFVDKPENVAVTDKVYKEFFKPGDEPASTTIVADFIPGDSHVEVTATATKNLGDRKIVRPSDMKNGKIFGGVTGSPAVWAGPTLYLSGMTGFDYKNNVLPKTAAEQMTQLGKNSEEILETAGLKLNDIVSGFFYTTDNKDFAAGLSDQYHSIFSKGGAARTPLQPYGGKGYEEIRVNCTFIAAKTQPAKK
jgi:2-iminobutanoate/2-iminopropanoate deaminase